MTTRRTFLKSLAALAAAPLALLAAVGAKRSAPANAASLPVVPFTFTDDELNLKHLPRTFFVHSKTGVDAPGFGESATRPFATLQYAHDQCDAKQHARICIMYGHQEVVTGGRPS